MQTRKTGQIRSASRFSRISPRCHVTVAERVVVQDCATVSQLGTARRVNEDRSSTQVANPSGKAGEAFVCASIHDGHGGSAVAEWLEQHLSAVVQQHWNAAQPEQSLTDAFLAADSKLLSKKAGFMGLGERGVGGSKCGATSALALMFADPANPGQTQLLTGNIGDARIVLVRGGQPVQLTVDHVPDDANERKRIEKFNPNPRMPLVRYVGGTWRVGGLLALSRAFGDAYLKGSLQFEGIVEGSDGYSSGFGVIAEPFTSLQPLTSEDSWLVLASDGLFSEEARGGGGGLDNAGLAGMLQAAGPKASCEELAKALATRAVELGSTDDVTVTVMKLGPRA
ncbi:phosphatase 2C-like domain-containing protein [Haematococcus lacustris]